MNSEYDIIIVGGGAAGFFTAINCAEINRKYKIAILERGKTVLEKVRISGGGRCNVTHHEFNPKELVKNYPRGEKELVSPFYQFCSRDTVEWFENHGVTLKTEEDGRMFPVSNSSQSIIDCFLSMSEKLKIDVLTGQSVKSIYQDSDNWKIDTNQQSFLAEKLILTTGNNPKIWEMLEKLGHTIISPVPSLFTFNIKSDLLNDLQGISAMVSAKINDTKLFSQGNLLITHWGLSGPAILRLSAWGARILAEKNYQFVLKINWLYETSTEESIQILKEIKQEHSKKTVSKKSPFNFPNRLWEKIVFASSISAETKWADVSKKQLSDLSNQLTNSEFYVNGKSTFKEEFVTAGGIDLKEVNFKTMESKLFPKLFFAGEILNIDAITGGFNFQNAWTTGFITANSICAKY
ncbi:MAG: NAD(P)/FAD-dependent oxidoreductase [Flavobacteriaceae bacterium]|jgi:predicted Rossmann fold flavoprotein|nr:NAD(P)/FAD-dependent oxidoreductase [Flavobacteriaceae bacterium]